ncbi:MAG: hypothetical protein GF372_10030 [Candidatus Marinimicrobia bacterium]|nr:hypothetical protein [Candidatus Neomarinimicrobiota bacterium]
MTISPLTGADNNPEFLFGMSFSEANQINFTPAVSEPFIPHSSFQPDCQPKCIYYETVYLGCPALGYVEFFDNMLYLHTYDLYPAVSVMKTFSRLDEILTQQFGKPLVHSQHDHALNATAIWEIEGTERVIVLSVVLYLGQQRLLLTYMDYSPDELHSATLRFDNLKYSN